jgi:hypothetical protein
MAVAVSSLRHTWVLSSHCNTVALYPGTGSLYCSYY